MRNQLLLTCGRCVVCGCTDHEECRCGCFWLNTARTVCKHCGSWALLHDATNYAEFFPDGIIPVCGIEPTLTPNPRNLKRVNVSFLLDVRRIDEETLMQIGMFSAPLNGQTIDDFLAATRDPRFRFPLDAQVVRATFQAETRDRVHRAVDELRETGGVSGARRTEQYVAVLEAVPSTPSARP